MDSGTPTQAPLVDETQAASLMSISPRTLQAWRAQGRGPNFVQAGARIRYCPRAIAAWIKANSATRSPPRKAKPVTLARPTALPPRMAELLAVELARGMAGDVYMGATAARRLSQALAPHEAVLVRALTKHGTVRADGSVVLHVPVNAGRTGDALPVGGDTVTVIYDPATGRWMSDTASGQAGIDMVCGHVWRLQGYKGGMAARTLLSFIGAAYLAHLFEGGTQSGAGGPEIPKRVASTSIIGGGVA